MRFFADGSINIFSSDKSDWNSRDLSNRNFKDFFFVKQIHSWDIYLLDDKISISKPRFIEADWIITNLTNVKIWVELADCNGIVIYWKKYIGVFHAWWKWLYYKIIDNWVKILLEKWELISDLKFYVWPSIRKCCYEVWDEFLINFDKKYFHKNFNGKLNFDMIWVIRDIFDKYWINNKNITIDKKCTKCWSNCYSYRNWNINERQIVWIGINN